MMYPNTLRRVQRGYVMLTSIVLVLMITLLALALVSHNSTQTRIATNSRDYQSAFQTAEAAMSQVNAQIVRATFLRADCMQPGDALAAGMINYVCTDSTSEAWQNNAAPWTANLPGNTTAFQGNAAAAPVYLVEKMPPIGVPGNDLSGANVSQPTPFRVTVKAGGANADANLGANVSVQDIVIALP